MPKIEDYLNGRIKYAKIEDNQITVRFRVRLTKRNNSNVNVNVKM